MAGKLAERDKRIIWHPYTPQKYSPDPIPIVKGRGALLFDEDGNTFIDAVSSWWVTVHGHAHPYIAAQIYQQALELEQVIFAGFTHEPAVQLAERLLDLLPGEFTRVFYSDNGSTATEVAVKMAIQYWWNKGVPRNKVIALSNSYHGDTFGAMSVSERSIFTSPFRDKLFEVVFIPAPGAGDPLPLPEEILSEAACIIYEPLIQGAGGMHMYAAQHLQTLLTACKERGIICIADEVMTGFGRTGKLFASSWCSTAPDIICLSKGLTGGTMALGVTACTAAIHEAFVEEDKHKTFFHGHSFTANPIACRAALASLDLFGQKETMENIERITGQHATFLQTLQSRGLRVNNLRQQGTIVAFEVDDNVGNYTSAIKEQITEEALKKGVYLRPLGNTVYIMPPYCITSEELEKVYAVILEILANL